MTVLIVVGYAAWVAFTLWLCYVIIGMASFFTMDTQDYKVWAVAWTLVLAVVLLSGYGLWALS